MRWTKLIGAIVLAACRARDVAPAPPSSPPIEPVSVAAAEAMRADRAALERHGWDLWREVNARYRGWVPSDRALGKRERFVRTPRPIVVDGRLAREELPVAFAVVFDPAAAAHVAQLGSRGALSLLRAVAAPLPDFPRAAIALKLVYFAVHADHPTRMPVWDRRPTRPSTAGNPDTTWPRAITVDRTTIADFVHEDLATDAEVAAARDATGDRTLARGDYLALVAMHVTTKELPDWIWATYWFDPDAPGHYRMDITTDATRPSFNPWLEARFPHGLESSCVACHRRAAFGARDYLPVTVGDTPPADPYFDDKLATDFIWSLALEAP